jgi:hypothetical protein
MNDENKNGALSSRLAKLPSDFADFSDIYERDLLPALTEKERERQDAWGRAKKFGLFGALGAIAVGAGGFLAFKSLLALIPAGILGGGVWAWGYSAVQNVAKQAKQTMIVPIANRFGLTYSEEPGMQAEENLTKGKALGVVPGWDRKSLSDELIGERNGIPFEFFEAHLEDQRTTTDSEGRSKTTWVTVFRGQCWVINAPKRFHGTTKIARDSGIFNALGAIGDKFSRVKLEDPEFEKYFEVYGTDQVEARFMLTPDVMQAYLDLEDAFKGSKLRATYHEDRIFVATEGGNLFEPGSMRKPLNDPERVGDLLEDFAAIFHLIDVLGKN